MDADGWLHLPLSSATHRSQRPHGSQAGVPWPLHPFSALGGSTPTAGSGTVMKTAEVLEKQRWSCPQDAGGPVSEYGIRRALLLKLGYVPQINSCFFVSDSPGEDSEVSWGREEAS